MRIALLADTYPPANRGGAGVVAQRLARAFAARGHDVLVVTTWPDATSEAADGDVQVQRLQSRYPERFRNTVAMMNPVLLGGVRRALEDFRPDVVHAHNVHQHLSFASLEVAASTGAPVAYTAHDFLLFCCIKFICSGGRVDFRQRWFNCAKCQRFRWNPARNAAIRRQMTTHVDHVFVISQAHCRRRCGPTATAAPRSCTTASTLSGGLRETVRGFGRILAWTTRRWRCWPPA